MKKLINTFTRIALLTLLFVTLTGCEKYDPDKNEISFYLNGLKLSKFSDTKFFRPSAIYYEDLDTLEIKSRVDGKGFFYFLRMRFPNPKDSKVYEDTLLVEFKRRKGSVYEINKCKLYIDEFNVKKKFDGFTNQNGCIKKRYVNSGGNVTGTFEFSGIKPKEFEAKYGKFDLQLQYIKDLTSN